MGCKRFATFKKFASSLVSQYVLFLPIEVWQVVDCQWLTKRSFDGQVLCQRMLIGPWARTTVGAATAVAAPAAAVARKRRRVEVSSLVGLVMESSRLGPVLVGRSC